MVGYPHQAPGGGTYQAQASTTIQVSDPPQPPFAAFTAAPALLPEPADGDGTAIIDAGGGDLSAPGGDVTRDWLLTASDLEPILAILFAKP